MFIGNVKREGTKNASMKRVIKSNPGLPAFVADVVVALTQARRALWVMGNATTLMQLEDQARRSANSRVPRLIGPKPGLVDMSAKPKGEEPKMNVHGDEEVPDAEDQKMPIVEPKDVELGPRGMPTA
eukprot:Gb_30826 [translate_table: standard]